MMGKVALVLALTLTLLLSGCGQPFAAYTGTSESGEPLGAQNAPESRQSSGNILVPRSTPQIREPDPSVRNPAEAPGRIASSSPVPSATISPSSPATAAENPMETPTPSVKRQQAGPSSVPPSPRYEPTPFIHDPVLDARVREFLGDEMDSYGVVIKRLSDGRGVAINPDRQFYAASLFKLLVMYEVFKLHALELLSFEESLTLTPPYLDYQLGELRWPLWSEVPIYELLEAMIIVSDNIAAMMLHDRVGGWNIVADTKGIGLEQTSISGEMPTSAGDMALLMEMIALGAAVDRESSQEFIDIHSRQAIDDRLPALLPEGTQVAHKTGNWENATHDVGIVYAPAGPYVIAILSEKPGDADTIAELSRLVYDHFEGRQRP